MYAEERRTAILGLARSTGRVDVGELAETLDVTPETVRRDLTALQRQGVLQRVHGGAILADDSGFESALSVRESVHTQEKARIAEAALVWPPVEGAIALDGGSTTHRFAEILPFDRSLTVVTNNLAIALPLAERTDLTVHIVVGRLRVGPSRPLMRSPRLPANRAPRRCLPRDDGFSIERGMTTPDSSEAAVKRAFIAAARRRVLLTDHTKFGLNHFAHVGDLAQSTWSSPTQASPTPPSPRSRRSDPRSCAPSLKVRVAYRRLLLAA